MNMKIIKILNTSVVLVKRNDNREVIVFGKGIGFKSKPGDRINPDDIEKTYILESDSVTLEVIDLLRDIPGEYLSLVSEIVEHTESVLKVSLYEHVYVSLIDHLYFAAKRLKQNMPISNRMHWEIQKLYPMEYSLGKHALTLAKQYLDVDFPEEEASNIAFHLINAQQVDQNMNQVMLLASIVKNILNIVKITFDVEFDTFSVNYSRFVNHLQFFAQRLVGDKMLKSDDDEFLMSAIHKYNEEYECALSINDYVKARFERSIPNEELLYLIIHINRVIVRDK
ncbi:transcriptional antiterminator, BglG family [Vibrio gazogenes DSM 21264]|uniref:Transcriptional antiterminator, BglG family n=2 Tax=Vibrio gazogenes TaxID=687 RepID=A0A1M4TB19_VIBGA|nr:transcriptional antiterminator, BglG family [Vibrio gazogenes DSM 21264] [Vibrio gazogenes DSM 21264 = NBRC 103151]SJN54287.1 Transcription antiterminator LicT [Vibrio gazogenes]